MRSITEIQEHGLARIADLTDQLEQEVTQLISEVGRDHWNIDNDEAWEIAFGKKPGFVAFRITGHLRVIADEILPDLKSNVREAATVTDTQLVEEWRRLWWETWRFYEGAVH